MSAREADANYEVMCFYASHLWHPHVDANGVWALSNSKVPPARAELIDGWTAVECLTLARRTDGPGYSVVAAGFPTREDAEAKIATAFGVDATEQAAA